MIPEITNIVLQNGEQATTGAPALEPAAAAAIAVGLAALGAGYAERGIGSAAIGAIAEDESMFVNGLILTVIPETIIILALVVIFLV